MARCTAPSRGHYTASGRANCPACGGGGRYSGGYSGASSFGGSFSSPSRFGNSGGGLNRSGSSEGKRRASWSPASSTVLYTPAQINTLRPVREAVVRQTPKPERRDIFLCHAWADRKDSAKDLHDLLEGCGLTVWFSEKDVGLGTPLMREIDRGLAMSRFGIVLVTPAFLERLEVQSIADKELSTLLAGDRLVPVAHNTTFEALRDVSPMLASRSGLSTSEEPMAEIAAKLAEVVVEQE